MLTHRLTTRSRPPCRPDGPHVLAELAVSDLGVIDGVTLVLDPGMTALTGETGRRQDDAGRRHRAPGRRSGRSVGRAPGRRRGHRPGTVRRRRRRDRPHPGGAPHRSLARLPRRPPDHRRGAGRAGRGARRPARTARPRRAAHHRQPATGPRSVRRRRPRRPRGGSRRRVRAADAALEALGGDAGGPRARARLPALPARRDRAGRVSPIRARTSASRAEESLLARRRRPPRGRRAPPTRRSAPSGAPGTWWPTALAELGERAPFAADRRAPPGGGGRAGRRRPRAAGDRRGHRG